MAKLIPDDPKQRNTVFVGIALLLAIYPFHSFWYKGKREEVTAMQARLETLESQNRRAQVLAARGGGDLEERMALYERHVAALEELIPAAEEVAGLIDDISQRSRQARVDLNRIIPEPPEPGAFYNKTSYEMTVVGEYHDVGRFLTDVASLSRIITPVDLDISLFDQAEIFPEYDSPIVANFRIETYVLPDQGAAAPQPGLGGVTP
ncbi:MAG: type 4a pilus biogenesis protein PilO [Gemmatimonadota bacterium]